MNCSNSSKQSSQHLFESRGAAMLLSMPRRRPVSSRLACWISLGPLSANGWLWQDMPSLCDRPLLRLLDDSLHAVINNYLKTPHLPKCSKKFSGWNNSRKWTPRRFVISKEPICKSDTCTENTLQSPPPLDLPCSRSNHWVTTCVDVWCTPCPWPTYRAALYFALALLPTATRVSYKTIFDLEVC